jgi:xylulokinase
MKYLIGVDIGTQATKAALYDTGGNLIAEDTEASRLISPAPGTVMQEPDDIFGSVLHTIKGVMDRSGVSASDVAALAFDGQMAGVMGVGEDFEAATYYDSWLDTRCEPYIELMKKTARKRVVELTGCPITYAHGPKILWWKHEHPEVYKEIQKFVMVHGYVAGKLCGLSAEDAFIDYTNIHFTGYADNLNKQWSGELLDIFDVDPGKMPMIVEPWKQVGTVRGDYAEQCGLLAGTPVMAGCGDSAATALGAGIVRVGQVFDVAGTASIFSCCVDTYAPDTTHEAMLQMRSVIDGYWQPLAYINGGGLCIRWFRDDIAHSDYAALEQQAAKVAPGSEGLIFNPHFAGRVCPNNPNVKGSFIGLDWRHGQGHMYRSIMEGIAYEYRYYLDVLRDIGVGQDFANVSVMGGGAKSRLFNQIKADVLGLTYQVLKNSDTATLGCVLIAGYGAGLFYDIAKTVESFTAIGDTVTPDHSHDAVYAKLYACYKEQFDALGDIYRQLKAGE